MSEDKEKEITETIKEEVNNKQLIDENNQLKQQLSNCNEIINTMNNRIIEQENLIKHYKLIAELHYNNIIGNNHE